MAYDFTTGAATLKKFAQQFRAVLDLAEGLEGVGSLEQAAQEAQARVDQARTDEAAAEKRLEEVHVAIAEAQAQLRTALEHATIKASEMVDAARSKALAIAAEADAKFQERTHAAEQAATATLQRVQEATQAAQDQADNARKDLYTAVAARDAAAAEHEQLVTKLAQIKEHAATILG